MSKPELVSITEAGRRLGVPLKRLRQTIEEYGLKIRMRGRVRLVQFDEVESLWQRIQSREAPSEADNGYQDRLISHLEKTVSRLEEENKELRRDYRMSQRHLERMMADLTSLKLTGPSEPIDVEVESRSSMMQGATVGGDEGVDLDNICAIIDENRGLGRTSKSSASKGFFSMFRTGE